MRKIPSLPSEDTPPDVLVSVGCEKNLREVPVSAERLAKEAELDIDIDATQFRPDVPIVNIVVLTGRLGQDAIFRIVGRDKVHLLTFSLAVEDEYDGGEKTTSWFSCKVWGARAKGLETVLKKGLRVGVTGKLGFESYTTRQGVERVDPVVIVNNIEVLQSKSEGGDRRDWGRDEPERAPKLHGYEKAKAVIGESSRGGVGGNTARSSYEMEDEEDDGFPF